MTLDAKALTVAQDRCETGHERALVELGIIAYIDHPDSGLVPRSQHHTDEMNDMVLLALDRDEARTRVDRLIKEVREAIDLGGERGRQLAALREALEKIAQLQRDKCENASAEMLFILLDNKVDCARAALTDTADAAARYRLVDDEHVVVPVRITEVQRKAAMETTGLVAWESWYDDLYEAAVQPWPSGKVEAGEGTEPEDKR